MISFMLLILVTAGHGYPFSQSLVPNGDRVLDPCDQSIWQGVGHQAKGGAGPRNPFGLDFAANGFSWTVTLCQMDSDGDGVTNGVELGDPDCLWSRGSGDPAIGPQGHPGICEPISSPTCAGQNSLWYSCSASGMDCPAIYSPDVRNITVGIPVTAVPAKETTYMCVNVALPDDQVYDIIADDAVVDNEAVVHHMVVLACPPHVTAADLTNPLGVPYECGMQGNDACGESTFVSVWTYGKPGFCYPDEAGIRIGPAYHHVAQLQFHWNNANERSDLTDGSGMILYYTPTIRQYQLGSVLLGTSTFLVPPQENAYTVESDCPGHCTSTYLTDAVYVISGMNHMHYAGKTMEVTLQRDGQDIALMHDSVYLYDSPKVHEYEPPIEMRPGDSLHTKCVYDTMSRNKTTFFGLATSDEMCYALLFVYPIERVTVKDCLSYLNISRCDRDDQTAVVDGCPIYGFIGSMELTQIIADMHDNCFTYTCLKECIPFIRNIREYPCFQERIRVFMVLQITKEHDEDFWTLFHSCDAEIDQEDNMCQPIPDLSNGSAFVFADVHIVNITCILTYISGLLIVLTYM